ncbi:MAG: hypothetical protein ABJ314_19145, partial [Ilumatobacter sp.]
MSDDFDEFDDGQWGTSNIDLVAEPVRYPRSPLLALLALALLPAVGLFVLHRWADGEADAYEDSRGTQGLLDADLDGRLAGADEEPTDDDLEDIDGFDVLDPVLATSLFDFRRAP